MNWYGINLFFLLNLCLIIGFEVFWVGGVFVRYKLVKKVKMNDRCKLVYIVLYMVYLNI